MATRSPPSLLLAPYEHRHPENSFYFQILSIHPSANWSRWFGFPGKKGFVMDVPAVCKLQWCCSWWSEVQVNLPSNNGWKKHTLVQQVPVNIFFKRKNWIQQEKIDKTNSWQAAGSRSYKLALGDDAILQTYWCAWIVVSACKRVSELTGGITLFLFHSVVFCLYSWSVPEIPNKFFFSLSLLCVCVFLAKM